jgi:sugar lactone lactonase YvrE
VVNSAGELIFSDHNTSHIRKIDASGVITTVAGLYSSTTGGYGGDGGLATAALISSPEGIAIDASGKLYFCDMGNYCVRTIDGAGTIDKVAGVPTVMGYSGDSGPATAANMSNVVDVAVDNSGNFFISDYFTNHRIRKVNAAGIINLYAGTGASGFSGDGGPATAANFSYPSGLIVEPTGILDIFDSKNNRIRQVSTSGIVTTIAGNSGYMGDGGNAILAQLQNPVDVCKDAAGNIYIADTGNHTVRKVNTSGIITTLAGTGQPGFSGSSGPATSALLNKPTGVACDQWGNVYIADMGNNIVSVVTSSGIINTFAGTGIADSTGDGGAALAATLNAPFGLAVDTSGNLYISDQGNNKIRMVNRVTGLITTYAGTGVAGYSGNGGPATAAELNSPAYIAFDAANNLYLADYNNNVIRMVNGSTGIMSTVFGNHIGGDSGTGGPATGAELCMPIGVAIDDSGGITTTVCGKIKHTPGGGTGGPVTVIAGNGRRGMTPDGTPSLVSVFNGASGTCYDASGHLMIADANNRVVRGTNLPLLNTARASTSRSRFTIVPNPNNGDFLITGHVGEQEQGKEINLVINNLLGQQVYQTQIPVDNNFITEKVYLKGVPQGLYFCRFTGKGFNETIQFLMQR